VLGAPLQHAKHATTVPAHQAICFLENISLAPRFNAVEDDREGKKPGLNPVFPARRDPHPAEAGC
jgi:hypothetical protein